MRHRRAATLIGVGGVLLIAGLLMPDVWTATSPGSCPVMVQTGPCPVPMEGGRTTITPNRWKVPAIAAGVAVLVVGVIDANAA